MSEQIQPFPLRMPPEIREWLATAAMENGRSLNSEIVQRLKEMQSKESCTSKL